MKLKHSLRFQGMLLKTKLYWGWCKNTNVIHNPWIQTFVFIIRMPLFYLSGNSHSALWILGWFKIKEYPFEICSATNEHSLVYPLYTSFIYSEFHLKQFHTIKQLKTPDTEYQLCGKSQGEDLKGSLNCYKSYNNIGSYDCRARNR